MVAWQVNEPGTYWTLADSPEYLPLAKVGSTTSWTIVDMRPLRPDAHARRLPTLSKDLRDVMFA